MKEEVGYYVKQEEDIRLTTRLVGLQELYTTSTRLLQDLPYKR